MDSDDDSAKALQRAREWAVIQNRGAAEIEAADWPVDSIALNARDYILFRVTWPAADGAFPASHYVAVDRASGAVERVMPSKPSERA